MSSKNDITGDKLISKVSTQKYRDNYDKIFRKNKEVKDDNMGPVESKSK